MALILVVDQDDLWRRAVEKALRRRGHLVTGAIDWPSMMAEVLRVPPQLLLLPAAPVGVTLKALAMFLRSRPPGRFRVLQRLPCSPLSFPQVPARLRATLGVDGTFGPDATAEQVAGRADEILGDPSGPQAPDLGRRTEGRQERPLAGGPVSSLGGRRAGETLQ